MWTKAFWKDAGERGVRSFAATLAAVWGVGVFNLLHVDWSESLGVAGGAAVLSVVLSVAAGFKPDTISGASLVKADTGP